MGFYRIFMFLFFCTFLFSCEKDKDRNPPIITLSSPIENTSYQVLDNVAIRANITDDVIIKSIQVSLIEEISGRKVLSSLFYTPNQSSFELEATFALDDSLLSTGRYYFKIEAQDEDNTAYDFRFIFINGIQKRLLGLVLLSESQSSTNIYLTNEALIEERLLVINEPHFATVLNSFKQQLWFTPNSKGNLLAYQLNNRQIEFDQMISSGFKEAYSGIDLFDNQVFVATKEGELIRFNSNYSFNYDYRAIEGRTFGTLKISSDYAAIEEFDLNGGNRALNVLFRNSAQRIASISIVYSCRSFYFLEKNKLILFQNDKNGGRITEVDVLAGGKRKLNELTDSILNVEQVSELEYLISTNNSVLRYNYSSNQLLEYILIQNSIVEYDALNNSVFIASEKEIWNYDYPSKTLIQQISNFPEKIVGMEVRYNK